LQTTFLSSLLEMDNLSANHVKSLIVIRNEAVNHLHKLEKALSDANKVHMVVYWINLCCNVFSILNM